jgi:hypothetical protein
MRWSLVIWCYPIGNGPEFGKKVWRKDLLPDIIHYSSILTVVAAGTFNYFSGFPDKNMKTVSLALC